VVECRSLVFGTTGQQGMGEEPSEDQNCGRSRNAFLLYVERGETTRRVTPSQNQRLVDDTQTETFAP
jgi:hypothetical protein